MRMVTEPLIIWTQIVNQSDKTLEKNLANARFFLW